jgi:hypothetical protein
MNASIPTKRANEKLTAKCRRIRQGWTESERHLRELQARLAQTRLALSILFREMGCSGTR